MSKESHAQTQADIIRLERELGMTNEKVPKQIDGVPVASRPDPGQVEKR